MNVFIVLGPVFIGLLILAFLIRKIKGLLITILLAIGLLIGGVVFVLAVPANPVSIWVTENIAGATVVDSNDKYRDGETIWSLDIDDSTEPELPTFEYKNLNGINFDELSSKITTFITKRAIRTATSLSTSEYTLQFQDSYLIVRAEESSLQAEIVKGVLNDRGDTN